jgi:4-amino-4-deoxy-L-arabinose transferase-like glycosyltransferase
VICNLDDKLLFFIIGITFLLLSICFFAFKKERYAIFFLISASAFLFLYAADLFQYLNVWDERFHALVAKNLMHHPLMPTLYDDPVVNIPYNGWDRYHIWLHKQPLFLWQIALSYKIFGVNEFALRIPSAMICCFLVFAGYRSGMILGNKDTGYYTGFLICSSFYLMGLISGFKELDHNDVAFLVYISLSLWAWLEYISSKNKWWLLAIGCFSGFAILCKWLVGLLVYFTWGIYSITENKLKIKQYWDLLLSLIITIIISLPWQLLIFHWYPAEAKLESAYTVNHLFTGIEGHDGPFVYHFNMINEIYGSWVLFLIVPALFIFYKNSIHKRVSLILIMTILFVYLFFSISKTKMPSFTTVAMLPMFIALAFLMDFLVRFFYKLKMSILIKRSILILSLMILIVYRLNLYEYYKNGTYSNEQTGCYQVLIDNKKVFQSLQLPANAVLFNVKGRHYIEAMFYTGLPAYNFIPTEEQYLDLKNKHRAIALFRPIDGMLPDYLKRDSTVLIFDNDIQLCE